MNYEVERNPLKIIFSFLKTIDHTSYDSLEFNKLVSKDIQPYSNITKLYEDLQITVAIGRKYGLLKEDDQQKLQKYIFHNTNLYIITTFTYSFLKQKYENSLTLLLEFQPLVEQPNFWVDDMQLLFNKSESQALSMITKLLYILSKAPIETLQTVITNFVSFLFKEDINIEIYIQVVIKLINSGKKEILTYSIINFILINIEEVSKDNHRISIFFNILLKTDYLAFKKLYLFVCLTLEETFKSRSLQGKNIDILIIKKLIITIQQAISTLPLSFIVDIVFHHIQYFITFYNLIEQLNDIKL